MKSRIDKLNYTMDFWRRSSKISQRGKIRNTAIRERERERERERKK